MHLSYHTFLILGIVIFQILIIFLSIPCYAFYHYQLSAEKVQKIKGFYGEKDWISPEGNSIIYNELFSNYEGALL